MAHIPTMFNGFSSFDFENAQPLLLPGQMNGFSASIVSKPAQTPKDVLRESIRENRERKGQAMPVIEKFKVVRRRPKKSISGEIPEDILRRREKNRKAAQKCRENRKQNIVTLEEKVSKWQRRNEECENLITGLVKERDGLLNLLNRHECHHHHPDDDHQPNSEQSCPDGSDVVYETGLDDNDYEMDSFTIEEFLQELPL